MTYFPNERWISIKDKKKVNFLVGLVKTAPYIEDIEIMKPGFEGTSVTFFYSGWLRELLHVLTDADELDMVHDILDNSDTIEMGHP